MCWHFDKKAQEQIFEDNPVWFEISGMGVMGRFTHPLPLPAPLELPAPYPILPLPDWGLVSDLYQTVFCTKLNITFADLKLTQKVDIFASRGPK